MIKNILKYALFGLAASFVFAIATIKLLEPRENLISELPQYWQAIWLVLLNAAGIAACFTARFLTPHILKVQKKNEKFLIVMMCLFYAFVMIMLGGRLSKGGLLLPMHESFSAEALAAIDILTFFCLMLTAYFVLYIIFEHKYKTQKNDEQKTTPPQT